MSTKYTATINGTNIPLTAQRCVVTKASSFSHTNVKSNSGATRVWSDTEYLTEFWLLYPNGTEIKYVIKSSDMDLKEDHIIIVLSASDKTIFSIYNTATRQVLHWYKNPVKDYNLYNKDKFGGIAGLFIILAIAVPILINIYFYDFFKDPVLIKKSFAIWGSAIAFGIIGSAYHFKSENVKNINFGMEKQFKAEIMDVFKMELKNN